MKQRGYIGLTDPDWYRYLAGRPNLDEVNFWQPHGGRAFRAIRPGDPFFFKLRAPHRAIAGFAFFERHETLPAWLAWDLLGDKNGAADFGGMIDRVQRLRSEESPRTGAFPIGCIMLTAPIFFPPDEWVEPPVDWARTGIQQGKTYDLSHGEGARVLRDCLERAGRSGERWNVERVAEDPPRYGAQLLVRPRLGQGTFSLAVRDAYTGACAVTGEHSVPALEAAHIIPYRDGGPHRIDNGMLLRSDVHRLFDRGYVTVTPDYIFRVGERLREEFSNGRSYYPLNGARIALPAKDVWHPDRERLAWHQEHVFQG
jgi:putative restriction endonuclease